MAPRWPDEVDVFCVPHTRMKKLVQDYKNLVSSTDFSNEYHMTDLLRNLKNVFDEFKAHERIENMLIMKRLRQKLKAASVNCAAVCNCHSDNRLTEMLDLVLAGNSMTQKTANERQAYGHQLQLALEDFTKNFIPHMEEEEEVFQPMLIKYFSYDELKELKANVIREHFFSKRKEYFHEKDVEELHQSEESSEVSSASHFDKLPNELCNKVFKFLTPLDLARCNQVCQRWNTLVHDSSLWPGIYPVHWARGNWTFHPESMGGVDGLGDQCNDDLKYCDELDGDYTFTLDEDADVDELEDEDKDNESSFTVKRNEVLKEAKMLTGMVKSLLPRIGHGLKTVDLAHSKGISSSLMHKILKLCKNIEVLDLSHTRIGDNAFVESDLMRSKLRHLDLTGCQNITDQSLLSLAGLMYEDCKVFDEEESQSTTVELDKGYEELEIENVPPPCIEKRSKCCSLYRTGMQDSRPPSTSSQETLEHCCDVGDLQKSHPALRVKSNDGQCPSAQSSGKIICCSTKRIRDNQENQSSNTTNATTITTTCCRDDFHAVDRQSDEVSGASFTPCVKKVEIQPYAFVDSSSSSASSDVKEEVDLSRLSDTRTSDSCESDCSKTDERCCVDCDLEPFCSPISTNQFDCRYSSQYMSSNSSPDLSCHRQKDDAGCPANDECCSDISQEKYKPFCNEAFNADTVTPPLSPLEFLSLNGCLHVSDDGLIALAEGAGTPFLKHLDLSGCMGVTGYSISRLVSTCRNLSHSNLFYCDHIPDDPYPSTACGCRNLEDRSRFCCTMNL